MHTTRSLLTNAARKARTVAASLSRGDTATERRGYNKMRTRLTLAASLICATAISNSFAAKPEPSQAKPLVQIAILLDTSNSMDGLIEQAKGQLWKICNEFIKAKQKGVAPEVQVALYEYGKSSLSGASGWIRRIQPLTTDLDKISEELFALKTNGGEEFCGWVIKDAVNELEWSPRSDVYKVIFIAGNEPFTQGPVSYAEACKAAINKGIIVNTIHCGTEVEGINGKWKDGATIADGKYLVIDHNRAVVSIEAPQDKEIARLGEELNKTYVAFGAKGKAGAERQKGQDANAAALAPASGATVQRAITKASANYQNSSWDLVDAAKDEKFEVAKLKSEELPAEMQEMNVTERKGFIDKKAKERSELQAKIQKLTADRDQYAAQRTKEAATTDTLDTAVISAVHEQGAKRNLVFE
jgi:hypothetical protein